MPGGVMEEVGAAEEAAEFPLPVAEVEERGTADADKEDEEEDGLEPLAVAEATLDVSWPIDSSAKHALLKLRQNASAS